VVVLIRVRPWLSFGAARVNVLPGRGLDERCTEPAALRRFPATSDHGKTRT